MSLYSIIPILFVIITIIIIIYYNNDGNNNNNISLKSTTSSASIYDNCLGSKPIINIYPILNNTIFADEDTIIDASSTVDENNSNIGLTYNWDIFGNESNKNPNINIITNQNKLTLPKFSYLNDGNLKVIFTTISSKIPYLTSTSLLNLNVINNTPTILTSPNVTSIRSNPYTSEDLVFTNNSYIGTAGNTNNLTSNWYITNNIYTYRDYVSTQSVYTNSPSTVSSLVTGNSITIPSRTFIPKIPSKSELFLVLVVTNSNNPSKSVTKIINIDRSFRLTDIWGINISTFNSWSKSGGSSYRTFVSLPAKVTPIYPTTSWFTFAWQMFDENNNRVNEIINPIYRQTTLQSPSLILKYELVRDILIVGRKYRFILDIGIEGENYSETFYSNLFTVIS